MSVQQTTTMVRVRENSGRQINMYVCKLNKVRRRIFSTNYYYYFTCIPKLQIPTTTYFMLHHDIYGAHRRDLFDDSLVPSSFKDSPKWYQQVVPTTFCLLPWLPMFSHERPKQWRPHCRWQRQLKNWSAPSFRLRWWVLFWHSTKRRRTPCRDLLNFPILGL